MAKKQTIEDRLRAAIKADGRSLYRLAKDAELGIGPVQRFTASVHGCTCTTAEKLAATLGFEVRLVRVKRRRK